MAASKAAANLSVWLVALPFTPSVTCTSTTINTSHVVTRGWADPQNRGALSGGAPLVPGEFVDVTFNLQPTDKVVLEGQRLGLMVFSSDRLFTLRPQPGTEVSVDLAATSLQLPRGRRPPRARHLPQPGHARDGRGRQRGQPGPEPRARGHVHDQRPHPRRGGVAESQHLREPPHQARGRAPRGRRRERRGARRNHQRRRPLVGGRRRGAGRRRRDGAGDAVADARRAGHLRRVHAGRRAQYTASTTANVISTAGDATLSVTDPSTTATGHLVNGTFSLPQPLQGLGVVKTYAAPVSNDTPTITFKQAIGASDALRTGTYSKTLTFTLSTTTP